MRQPLPSLPPGEPLFISMAHASRALRLLREAWDAARAENQDIWQFAIEIGPLLAAGLSHTDLRRLVCRGLLEHGVESTAAGAGRRTFQPLRALVLPERCCFVLTGQGLAEVFRPAAPLAAEEPAARQGQAPRWDGRERQLWWGDAVVKEFRVPAANQERVLAALQEEGWPSRIDDPLPPVTCIDPKVRLHDTIKALNRHHRLRILRFSGDGCGRGILWSLAPIR